MQLLLMFFVALGVLSATITEIEIVKVFVGGHLGWTNTHRGTSSKTSSSSETGELESASSSTAAFETTSMDENELYSSIYQYSGSYKLNETFSKEVAKEHNEKRKLHGAQMLHWNNTVYEYAAAYAEKYDCSGVLKHSGGKYGENLAIGYTNIGAINAWYDEGDTYNYGSESTYNHFTAMIWNSSSSVGCAYKNCNGAWGMYLVCSYYPAGNVIGESTKNVFPLV